MKMKRLGIGKDYYWRFSAKTLTNTFVNCTVEGITAKDGCGGACCHTPFWPASAQPVQNTRCRHLTHTGCSIGMAQRPIVCLMYPLKFNKQGTIILHHRSRLLGVTCYPCKNKTTKPLYEIMEDSLIHIIGPANYKHIVIACKIGNDPVVQVPQNIITAYNIECQLEKLNQLPQPRRIL